MKVSEPSSGKIKLDFKFTVQLQRAITAGQLVQGQHKTGDWLQSLADPDLQSLINMAEHSLENFDAADHICSLVLTLTMLESGKPLASNHIAETDLLMATFKRLLQLEQLRRQGYLKVLRALSLSERQSEVELTERGEPIADQIYSLCKTNRENKGN